MKIIGHRGYSSRAPENTLSSFKLALETSYVDMIECDVHMTSDNKLVVIHDYTINRTSNGEGLIEALTYDELKTYDCGGWFSDEFQGENYSLLTDVLTLLEGKKPLVIELKRESRHYPEMAKHLVATLEAVNFKESIYIKSFDHELIYEISQLTCDYKLGLLFFSRPMMLIEQLKHCDCQFVSLYGGAMSQAIIEACSRASIEIMVWTIDEAQDVQAIWQASRHIGIVSNKPEIANSVREAIENERDH